MGFVNWKTRIIESIQKYKYVCIVLLLGLILMMIPGKGEEKNESIVQQTVQSAEQTDMEEELARILSRVKGAGKVNVMLAVAQGERIIYQTDSNYSQSENTTDSRTQTILITDSGRNEAGLVHQKNPPSYKGAIILAQGADNPTVRLALADAVSNITGLGTDKISILKMQ